MRLQQVLDYLEKRGLDALCLQETRTRSERFPFSVFEERGYNVAEHGTSARAGVALISRHELEHVQRYEESPLAGGRRLTARCLDVFVDVVYVPATRRGGKVEFLDALRADYSANFQRRPRALLCGDFNLCTDERDFASPSMITDAAIFPSRPEDDAFRALRVTGLTDCFRLHEHEGGHFTWFGYGAWTLKRNYGMRLDYVFASPVLAAACRSARHDLEPRRWPRPSDHAPVITVFEWE